MLVVVHHRYVKALLQPFLNVKAFGCLDVFKVDASESGRYALYGLAEFLRVFLGHLDVEHVDAAVYLEQQALALHHRLSAYGPYVAEAQHGGAVAYHGHKVALVGIFVGVFIVLLYFQARICHARRIRQAQVCLCPIGFCGFDLDFSRPAIGMILQCGLL